MVVFVDTSAFYALLDGVDPNHGRATRFWAELMAANGDDSVLFTTNYVILETISLIQRRLGMDAVRAFQRNVIGSMTIVWLDETLHQVGVEQVLTANRRQLSLVDCTSFATMRSRGVTRAFAFDHHFAEQGFTLLPEAA